MAMTRTQMEAVIAQGGSVLHQGRIISQVADLPTEADLAGTDAEKADAAQALQAKIDALQAQIDALTATRPGAAPRAKDEKAAKKAENL